MKSRWTTCLLLAAVAVVWGIVAWKIFAPANDAAPAVPPRAAAPVVRLPVADTLLLNYPDPFLKGQVSAAVAAHPVVRSLPPAKVAACKRERVAASHLGTVASAWGRLYILTVGSEQYEIPCGGSAGDFVLAGCDRDSLYLRKGGVTYGVKLCD